jgi:hypothetical protein
MADDLKGWLAQQRAAWTGKTWWGAGPGGAWSFTGPDLSPEQLDYVKARGRCAHCHRQATARRWLKLVKPDGEPVGISYLVTPRAPRGTLAECPLAPRAADTGAAALLAVFALGGGLSALWVMALATLVLVALCALETLEPHPSPAAP